MSYLTIPTATGASRRRVDLAAIAELFGEDDVAMPRRDAVRGPSLLQATIARCAETLSLLRDEALARKLQHAPREPRAVRAFGM